MDGLRKQVDGSTSAMVVRQFSPSRIEKQLLAQTFELLIGLQTEADVRPDSLQLLDDEPFEIAGGD